MTLSDRIAVFRAGRLVQTGTPQELYRRPLSRFVAEFVGEANLLPTTGGSLFLVRPEEIKLSRSGKNDRHAALVDLVFAGDCWRATLRDDAERVWMARMSEAEKSALSPLPGERLHIGWQDQTTWIISNDGQA